MTRLIAPKPQPKQPAGDPATDYALTALDRCDRCGAQAYVKYENPSVSPTGEAPVFGGPLSGTVATFLFCAHHTREHRHALGEQGFLATVDETGRLDAANAAFKDPQA